MNRRADQVAQALNAQREAFKAFLVARVGNAAEAEDILQNGLLKALHHAGEIADTDKTVAWFYQVLRHAVIDHYRSRGAVKRRNDALGATIEALGEDVAAAPPGWEAQLCGCLGSVIGSLKPRYAELLRRVELEGEPVNAAARALGITPGNASITLHRARQELRDKLRAFCGACADGACLDCHCAPTAEKRGGA
ncbi:MAG: sigma-70 family RNA polymerase sigma factor [Opitutae bacterium]|nr:sigma-70 family RNA polymerase sigma factor [Opitutae bacterium]